MPEQNHFPRAKANKKRASIQHLMRSCHEVLERELIESLNKIEHRAEISIVISGSQRKSGCNELAEAYMKLGMNSKTKARPIRKYDLELSVNCHRCGGMMVFQQFYGPCEFFWGWRCIYCGEIVDEVILENRFSQERRVLKDKFLDSYRDINGG